MFRYSVRGENIEVAGAIRDYVEKKVGKLECYFSDAPDTMAHVNLKVYTEKTVKAEVTTPLSYLVLRVEETFLDLYASIDLVIDGLERQIRRSKIKINRGSRETGMNTADAAVLFNGGEENGSNSKLDIVCTKRLPLRLMDSEEAAPQMSMLGHNFFIFEDAETNGTSIVHHRKDGKYGLIETD